MKILHIGKYFPPYAGGMETYLRDLIAAQARQGINAQALVHRSHLSFSSKDEYYETGDHKIPITRAAVWARLLFTPISPTFPWLLRRLIKQQQPDILHLHMPNVSVFWALFLPSARRIPWVVQWHSDVLASRHSLGLRLFYALYRPFERAILKRSGQVITSSPPYLESSLPLRGFRAKCQVIALGLDPANLPEPGPTILNSAAHRPLRVLAIGRLTYYKGFEYLVRAAAECGPIEVHIVGKGDEEAMLKALSRELKLGNRITFHGHLPADELAEQFGACDCLCLPSIERTEAFGMVLLEAMHHGKATVISNVRGSGMGWVVDDGITGLHVPPGDAGELANSLGQLQQNRDKIHQLGESGRQKFDRRFHIDRSATAISALYKSVLKPARGNPE